MYSPDRDMRIGGADSEVALAAKKRMAHAFDSMKGADDPEIDRLWQQVRESRATLDRETEDRVRAYGAKARGRDDR